MDKQHYFKKFQDKNGKDINLGDNLYGEDGKLWRVLEIKYSLTDPYTIKAQEIEIDYKNEIFKKGKKIRDLKPKWLSSEVNINKTKMSSEEFLLGQEFYSSLETIRLLLECHQKFECSSSKNIESALFLTNKLKKFVNKYLQKNYHGFDMNFMAQDLELKREGK